MRSGGDYAELATQWHGNISREKKEETIKLIDTSSKKWPECLTVCLFLEAQNQSQTKRKVID